MEVVMRILSPTVFLTMLCAGAAAAQPAPPPAGTLAADLERDWTAQKARLVALAEAMPADKYDYKATPPQRTYGEQLAHLAEAHVRMFGALDPEARVPAPALPTTHGRDETVKAVRDAYDYGLAVMKSVKALDASAKSGEPTAARTVWAAMNNAMNHYGQCVVYLRLNGIVPPASR
jgi:uncharacterized damage-inducible protein DinB